MGSMKIGDSPVVVLDVGGRLYRRFWIAQNPSNTWDDPNWMFLGSMSWQLQWVFGTRSTKWTAVSLRCKWRLSPGISCGSHLASCWDIMRHLCLRTNGTRCIPVSHGAFRICSMVSYECSNDGPKMFPVDQPTKEDMYLRFRNAIENVNVIIVTWPGDDGPNMTQLSISTCSRCVGWFSKPKPLDLAKTLVPSCPQQFPNDSRLPTTTPPWVTSRYAQSWAMWPSAAVFMAGASASRPLPRSCLRRVAWPLGRLHLWLQGDIGCGKSMQKCQDRDDDWWLHIVTYCYYLLLSVAICCY